MPSVSAYVSLAFASATTGIILESTGPEGGGQCHLAVRSTSDGGLQWSVPVRLPGTSTCADAYATGHSMAVSPEGTWWVATDPGLASGSIGGTSVHLALDGPHPVPGARDPACAVSVDGASVAAMIGTGCVRPRQPVEVVVSSDGGTRWHRTSTLPVDILPSSLAWAGPDRLVAVGIALSAKTGLLAPLLLVSTSDAGVTWTTRTLPCARMARFGADLAVEGRTLVVACLGEPSAGYQPIEVVRSNDGGLRWGELCNNDLWGSVRSRGACPRSGYPQGIALGARNQVMMTLAYIGTVEVSTDDGGNWRRSLVLQSSYSIALSVADGRLFALPEGPYAHSALLVSNRGRHWSRLRLPAP